MILRRRWLLLPLGATALIVWSWPLLWLWSSDRSVLLTQERDADVLFAAAPRAVLAPQKVGGPANQLQGRYLSRRGRMNPWMKRQGFVFSGQMGSLRLYNKGADLQASTICRRFSAGFEVCALQTQRVRL